MQAICDNQLNFIWIDISWPGCTADFMAWVTSGLYTKIESTQVLAVNAVIRIGYTILGDNAYVKSTYTSVPFKGVGNNDALDAYNFYESHLRITIERAFGVLVHRWAILRGPLVIPVQKVAPLVNCLCCLHNFCIDKNTGTTKNVANIPKDVAEHLYGVVQATNVVDSNFQGAQLTNRIITFDNQGAPCEFLGGGDHFDDCPHSWRWREGTVTPMDVMVQSIESQQLPRPLAPP
jgi:hypothetical protein